MADGTDTPRTSLHVFPDLEALSRAAAQHVVSHIDRVLSEQDRYTLALAGGSTPSRLYELLADVYSGSMRWEKVHLFWGDERFVPHGHPKSNVRLVHEHLIDHIDIPAENVHPIPTGSAVDNDPKAAAQAYTETLKTFFDTPHRTFDATLLGLGRDGHTASLFPGSRSASADSASNGAPDRAGGNPSSQPSSPSGSMPSADSGTGEEWVRVVTAPSDHDVTTRLTLSLPVLNGSSQVLFLVSGADKREALSGVLDDDDPELPATHVSPRTQLSWFLDTAARPQSPL